MNLPIYQAESRSILSPVSGFLAEAGFTHSLTPARNCTYGCTYCYVPTMRVYGGLKQTDWKRWGQFTTFKVNAAALLRKELRPAQIIYLSPLVDPYQPAEGEQQLMPGILQALIANPPAIVAIQTRGPLILRDRELLQELATRTALRVSFSITTDDDEVRRHFEPLCESNSVRLATVRSLVKAGIETYTTLAPLLPCDPGKLAHAAMEASPFPLIADPLHIRATKAQGATTREAAFRIAGKHGWAEWFEPAFQARAMRLIARAAQAAGRDFATGPEGFGWLAKSGRYLSR